MRIIIVPVRVFSIFGFCFFGFLIYNILIFICMNCVGAIDLRVCLCVTKHNMNVRVAPLKEIVEVVATHGQKQKKGVAHYFWSRKVCTKDFDGWSQWLNELENAYLTMSSMEIMLRSNNTGWWQREEVVCSGWKFEVVVHANELQW